MFCLSLLVLALPLTTLAGQVFPSKLHARSRKHRNVHHNIARNLTARAPPQAKVGSMTLVDKYSGKSFFDEWDFFTADDPTHGAVQYVSKGEATSTGLAFVGDDNVAVLAVDDKNPVPLKGKRKSVRITSQKTYTGGLFVMDANAMPSGCATWPAFWTVAGANWPQNGEIDIVEGVNKQTQNQMTLHTAPGCTLDASAPPSGSNAKSFIGKVLSTTCDALANSNAGCGVTDPDPTSFGPGVANGGGAVYAMLWDSVGIRVWHFTRATAPADLTAFAPNPSTWPEPSAFWSTTTCPMAQFFGEHNIVINTSLCGDFAGGAYPSSGCPATCEEHITDPSNFKDAKWKINYVAIFR